SNLRRRCQLIYSQSRLSTSVTARTTQAGGGDNNTSTPGPQACIIAHNPRKSRTGGNLTDHSGGVQFHASPRSACPITQPSHPRSAKSASEKSSVGTRAASSQNGRPNWLVAVGRVPGPLETSLMVLVGASTVLAPMSSAGNHGNTAKATAPSHAGLTAPIRTGSTSIRTLKKTGMAGVAGFAVVPQALVQP